MEFVPFYTYEYSQDMVGFCVCSIGNPTFQDVEGGRTYS